MKNVTIRKENIYPATFTVDEVISDATVSLTPNKFVEVGRYVVLADEFIGIGKGGYDAQNTAIGRLYALFKDGANAAITKGKFRIEIRSSQDQPVGSRPTYLDVDLAAISAGANTLTDRFVLPFNGELCGEDRVIKFSIMNTTAAAITLTKANCTVLMDITRAIM